MESLANLFAELGFFVFMAFASCVAGAFFLGIGIILTRICLYEMPKLVLKGVQDWKRRDMPLAQLFDEITYGSTVVPGSAALGSSKEPEHEHEQMFEEHPASNERMTALVPKRGWRR